MKKGISHIISLSLAYLFLTVGCGVNIAEYCCKSCAEHGERMFTVGSCNDVHKNHHHHEHVESNCCEHPHHVQTPSDHETCSASGNACKLERLKTSEPTLSKAQIIVHFSFLAAILLPKDLELTTPTPQRIDFKSLKSPPNEGGRAILTFVSKLTI